MLYFITGKPGNGKTLYAIQTVESLRKDTGRPVYYCGVTLTDKGREVLANWTELKDPLKWYDCPDGSIIFIDEVQTYWRVRSKSGDVPEAVKRVETHRHRGFDLFYLTQDPLLVDTNIRKLVWEHTHIKRKFGLEMATLWRWKQRVASPDSKHEYKDAISTDWKYPKDLYQLYKSAELHTAKADIPWRKVLMIAGLALCMVGACVYVFSTAWGPQKKTDNEIPFNHQDPLYAGSPIQPANPWSSDRFIARVYGRPESSPAYDRLQQIKSQPSPAGCSQYTYDDGTTDCTCSTSQGSKIDMPVRQCLQLIKNGWFDFTRPYEDKKAINIAYLNSKDRAFSGQLAASTQRSSQPPEQSILASPEAARPAAAP